MHEFRRIGRDLEISSEDFVSQNRSFMGGGGGIVGNWVANFRKNEGLGATIRDGRVLILQVLSTSSYSGIFLIESIEPSVVRLKGKNSGKYICFNKKRKLVTRVSICFLFITN